MKLALAFVAATSGTGSGIGHVRLAILRTVIHSLQQRSSHTCSRRSSQQPACVSQMQQAVLDQDVVDAFYGVQLQNSRLSNLMNAPTSGWRPPGVRPFSSCRDWRLLWGVWSAAVFQRSWAMAKTFRRNGGCARVMEMGNLGLADDRLLG